MILPKISILLNILVAADPISSSWNVFVSTADSSLFAAREVGLNTVIQKSSLAVLFLVGSL